ncbi:hypothetical protein FRC02_008382 [Tulasnella sp. 418]|nr:hypothetical protein FRC02_008382 [Tulasnella sp. 418]
MPPKNRGGGRGAARGGFSNAGRGGGTVGGGGPRTNVSKPTPGLADETVMTIGVRRKAYGESGRRLTVVTNSFGCEVPDQGQCIILPADKTLPPRMNMQIIESLQTCPDYVDIFSPRAVYDGRKIMVAPRELPFGDAQEFAVTLGNETATPGDKTPKVYHVRLTKVAKINPEALARFIVGTSSHDNTVLTAITALNILVRMEPSMRFPFNARSFFTNSEAKDIRGGYELWRGYFQSVRPAIGRMVLNVDTATGLMFKAGHLVDICCEFFETRDTNVICEGMPDRKRLMLQKFLHGLRVITMHTATPGKPPKPMVIKKVSPLSASQASFMLDGKQTSVATYLMKAYNKKLTYPRMLCVETGSGALVPIELLTVLQGQLMRKQVPSDKTKSVVEFSTMHPNLRKQSIIRGLEVLQYGQSEYLRSFGMTVDPNLLKIQARVLPPPVLTYGNKQNITPAGGAWNMTRKKFFQPATVNGMVLAVFVPERNFTRNDAASMLQSLKASFDAVGITYRGIEPMVSYCSPQSAASVDKELRSLGGAWMQKTKSLPSLILAVMAEGNANIYNAVKHFGDIQAGVATQGLRFNKCKGAREQYWANVCLKINVKLGGINSVPDPRSVPFLSDVNNKTLVLGADSVHPSPGSAESKPSFASLVGNIDSMACKYIATSRVQPPRQEMIEKLKDMTIHILDKYLTKSGGTNLKRVIFYRDGVSEGQFQQVLDLEVPQIKEALAAKKINAKITVIVVGKRHHVRFFPDDPRDADKSGNCPAGTVVDSDIAHPTEFDFYLQSHGGLLGTSRPSHYSVLLDENNFTPDALQQLSFALCHVYARSTRSVSIPAPVYYADIVCARAVTHYDPAKQAKMGSSEGDGATTASGSSGHPTLDQYIQHFKPLNKRMEEFMYFS